MRTSIRIRRHDRRGSILVLSSVILVVALAFTAMVVDLSYVSLTRTELQNAADAAALAGALELGSQSSTSAASTAAARTITMPSAATVGAGKTYIIKDESGGAATNNISIASVSSQTFDGAASPLVINTNYGTKTLYSDGANWFTI